MLSLVVLVGILTILRKVAGAITLRLIEPLLRPNPHVGHVLGVLDVHVGVILLLLETRITQVLLAAHLQTSASLRCIQAVVFHAAIGIDATVGNAVFHLVRQLRIGLRGIQPHPLCVERAV